MTISHHGGDGSLRRSCSHTVGIVPKNSHRSASACQCHIVGRPIKRGRSPAQVVGDEHQRERQPVADDVEHPAALADAGRQQTRAM